MNIDPIRPYLDLIKVGLILLAFSVAFIGGCNHGAGKWQGKFDAEAAARKDDQSRHAALIEALDARARVAEDKVKAAGQQALVDRKLNDATFRMLSNEAQQARSDLARALRNGNARLRPEFACAAPRPAAGGAAAAAGGQDDDADLRRAREGAILDAIADADSADAWIGWLQTEVVATRKACGVL